MNDERFLSESADTLDERRAMLPLVVRTRLQRTLDGLRASRLPIGPRAAFETAVGPRHGANEDRVLVPDDIPLGAVLEHGWLYAVADGVSRSAGGAYASQLALGAIAERFYGQVTMNNGRPGAVPTAEDALYASIDAAQVAVRTAAETAGSLGLACTVVAVLLTEHGGWLASVGDSRIYRVRNGRAVQLSMDHTVAAALLEREAIDEATAAAHPGRKILARAIGADDATPDVGRINALRSTDRLVLVTDGVTDVLSDAELAHCIMDLTPQKAAAAVMHAVRTRGLVDDTTVLVVSPVGPLGAAGLSLVRRLRSPRRIGVALGLVTAAVLVGATLRSTSGEVPRGAHVASAAVTMAPRPMVERRSAAQRSAAESIAQAGCRAADVTRNGTVDMNDVQWVIAVYRAATIRGSVADDKNVRSVAPALDPDSDGRLTGLDAIFVDGMIGCTGDASSAARGAR